MRNSYRPVRLLVLWVGVLLLLANPARAGQQPNQQTPKLQIEGDRAIFTTERMIAVIRNGVLVRIFNRLTGTEYIVSPPKEIPKDFQTALIYTVEGVGKQGENASVSAGRPVGAGVSTLVPDPIVVSQLPQVTSKQLNEHTIEYTFRSEDDQTVLATSYSLDPVSGDLVIQQKGNGKRQGLTGVRLGLWPITCRGNLLLPVFNGIKAARGNPFQYERTDFEWPMRWQLPFVIFNDALGGFWIHTQDPKGHFKNVNYHYEENGTWGVAFSTLNAAPFGPHDSVESVGWRVNTYAGDWTVPVDYYRTWAYRAYHIAEKERLRPSWVDNIRLEIRDADNIPADQITEYLDLLRQYVVPSKTLLIMTQWTGTNMVDDKQVVVPRWVASKEGAKFNQEARKRGFRTMYFTNYFGITPNHPRLEEFRPCFIKNPYTHKYEGWNLEGEWSFATSLKLYYVNPACKSWRDYQASEFKTLFEHNPADGLYLDQAFHMYNDDNGLIDGQSSVEGNLEFHRQVAEALPGVALLGESVNEISMQYESFCQLHLLSMHPAMDSQGKGSASVWKIEPAAFDRMVPLVPRYILPHTRITGSFAQQPASNPYYADFRDALHLYGGIPSLTRPTLAEIQDSESEVRRVFREAMARK
jgi:hypothetical protein